MTFTLFNLFSLILGLLVGSFLNVVIYRMPRSIDIVFERSNCPSCKKVIPWFLNVPFFSFLILKGRCKFCGVKISSRYPLVELLTGLVFCLTFPNGGSELNLLLWLINCACFSAMLAMFFIDLDYLIIPDSLNLFLLMMAILKLYLTKQWLLSIVGAGLGFFIPISIAYFYLKIKNIEGLGGGDIKLYSVLGLLFGPQVVITIFLSSLVGIVFFLVISIKDGLDKERPIPFGPSIIIVSWAQIFFPKYIEKFFF